MKKEEIKRLVQQLKVLENQGVKSGWRVHVSMHVFAWHEMRVFHAYLRVYPRQNAVRTWQRSFLASAFWTLYS